MFDKSHNHTHTQLMRVKRQVVCRGRGSAAPASFALKLDIRSRARKIAQPSLKLCSVSLSLSQEREREKATTRPYTPGTPGGACWRAMLLRVVLHEGVEVLRQRLQVGQAHERVGPLQKIRRLKGSARSSTSLRQAAGHHGTPCAERGTKSEKENTSLGICQLRPHPCRGSVGSPQTEAPTTWPSQLCP